MSWAAPLSRAEIEEVLTGATDAGKRQQLQNVLDAIRSIRQPLQGSDCIAAIAPITNLSDSRIVKSFGSTDQSFRPSEASVVDIEVHLLDISGAIVTKYNSVVVDDQLLSGELGIVTQNWWKRGHFLDLQNALGIIAYDPEEKKCIVRLEQIIQLNDPRGYFLFNSYASLNNFGHFVHDLLLQLFYYEQACELSGTRLVPILASDWRMGHQQVGQFRYPMLKVLFDELIVNSEEAVFLDGKDAKVGKCFACTATYQASSLSVSRPAASYLKQRIDALEMKEIPIAQPVKRVWVSRGDGLTNRKTQYGSGLDNEGLLDDIAENCGYSVLRLSELLPGEILYTMRHAEVLAGMHGAGLFNSVFCRPGTRMIEGMVAPWTYETVWIMAEAFGLNVERIGVNTSLVGDGYSVKLADLITALRR